jgi:hypothetical protein
MKQRKIFRQIALLDPGLDPVFLEISDADLLCIVGFAFNPKMKGS